MFASVSGKLARAPFVCPNDACDAVHVELSNREGNVSLLVQKLTKDDVASQVGQVGRTVTVTGRFFGYHLRGNHTHVGVSHPTFKHN